MSVIRSYYYDPFAEFDRLFDNAFTARFPVGTHHGPRRDPTGKLTFQPKYVTS
jgi:hypothetical protein